MCVWGGGGGWGGLGGGGGGYVRVSVTANIKSYVDFKNIYN